MLANVFVRSLVISAAACFSSAAIATDYTRPMPLQSAKCQQPRYPKYAVQRGHEGVSVVAILIKPDGTPSNTSVMLSSGYDELDQAILHSLSKCTYRPGINRDEPVELWSVLLYIWRIEGDFQSRIKGVAARAAAKGDAAAHYQLALAYQRDGDAERSHALQVRAAELGHPLAQFQLGQKYEKGDHVEKDLPTAMIWYQKAADRGNVLAKERIKLGALPREAGESRNPS